MPTYRVYIRRQSTRPPVWDWMQTVVANNESEAVGYSYACWKNESRTPVPPLYQCYSSVTQKAALMALAASGVSPVQQAFIDALKQQVSQILSTQLDGEFNPVIYPSGFNYGITYGSNAYYNQATLQDVDTLLGTASNGTLELTSGGFSTLYTQVLQGVTFSFSSADQGTINSQDAAASGQIASIITEFTNAGGTFSNPLPLGGKLQDIFNQLTAAYKGLNKLPSSLNALRNAIATYQAIAGDSYALHNRYYAATARLSAALAHATKPSAKNGGMQVDATHYYAGYTPDKLPSANRLIGGLNTAGNAVSLQISLSDFSSNQIDVQIAGQAGLEFPIADVIGISLGASGSYDMSDFVSSQSTVTMDMTYPGVTLFPAKPSDLSADNVTGWYANDILSDVAVKSGQDATGYKLQSSEWDLSELFGKGGHFSRLKTFVISQAPTITMTFSNVDASRVTSAIKANASARVDLLGLFTLGSASGSYSVQKVDAKDAESSVAVTFGPPAVSGTIPLEQQVAYVLGGVASYPPDNI